MGWPFGSKKDKAPTPAPSSSSGGKRGVPDVNASLQKMADSEDTLAKRDLVLTKKIQQELAAARAAQQKGNKALALRHLKQKKLLEEQQTRLSAQISNISAMRGKMEEMQTASIVAGALGAGANDMTAMKNHLNIDKIDDVMDKVSDAMADAGDIADRLAQPLGNDLYDEDELLGELDELDQLDAMDLSTQLNQIKSPAGKAPAPAGKVSQHTEEEDELDKLEAMMNA